MTKAQHTKAEESFPKEVTYWGPWEMSFEGCPGHLHNQVYVRKDIADELLEALECSRAMDWLNQEGTSAEMREWALQTLEQYGYTTGGSITYQQFVCEKTDAAISKARGQ